MSKLKDRAALSVAEAAELLGVSERFLWSCVERGDIASVRLGRRVLLPADGLRKLLESSDGETGEAA